MAARFPTHNFDFYHQPQWPLDTKPDLHDEDDLSVLDEKILDPTTPGDLSAAPESHRGQFHPIGRTISAKDNMWHEMPQEMAAQHVRHHSYPGVPHIETGHPFVRMDPAYAAAYTQPHHLPMSANSGTSTPTPVYEHVAQGFQPVTSMHYHGDHFPFSQMQQNPEPASAIPMSPQSSQGGWMSATSSDGTEPRSRPVRSPSYRATSPMSHLRQDGIRKKNARFEIPAERNLHNIDTLIMQSNDETEKKELKQQKRLLRNRQAALDSRQRKKQHTEKLEVEKKEFTQHVTMLEEQRQQIEDVLQQEREQWMHQRQQLDHYIRQLEFARDEAIRTKTLETADLRQKNNILQGHIRDLERHQAMTLHNNPPSDFSNDFSSFNIDDGNWDEDFALVDNPNSNMDHNEPAAPPQQAPVAAPRAADIKSDAASSMNAFYMCLLIGAFFLSNSNSNVTSNSLQASIPPLSDEYRAESANVLKAVLESSPESSHPMLPSHPTNRAPTTISGAEMAHITNHPSNGHNTMNLNQLHQHLITPSRQQQEAAAFSLSAASYNHLTNPDPFLSTGNDGDFIEAKPSRLEFAYAQMQESRPNIDRVISGNLQERSLLWERVPEKVLRDFRRMVEHAEGGGGHVKEEVDELL